MEPYRPGAVVSHRYRILSMLGQGGMGAVFRAFDRLTAQEVALKSVRPPDRSRSSLMPLGIAVAAKGPRRPDDLAAAAALAATAPFAQPPQEPTAPASLVEALARTAPFAEAPYRGSVPAAPPSPGTADTTALRLALAHEFQTLASLRHSHIVSVLDYGFEAGQPFFTMELLRAPAGLLPATRNLDIPARVQLLVQVAQGLMYLHRRGILHRDLKPSKVDTEGRRTNIAPNQPRRACTR